MLEPIGVDANHDKDANDEGGESETGGKYCDLAGGGVIAVAMVLIMVCMVMIILMTILMMTMIRMILVMAWRWWW